MDPQTLSMILVIAFLVLSLGIHEAAHAWVANLRGDDTAKQMGRMTLNPIVHIDLFMSIILPLFLMLTAGFAFGGAKPVPVDVTRLKRPALDMVFVSVAGPLSNLILAFIFTVIFKILVVEVGMDPRELAPLTMAQVAVLNVVLAGFNMIPIPPLDGSRVMAYFLPRPLRETYVSLERFGMLLILALVAFGGLGKYVSPDGIFGWLLNMTGPNWI